MRYLVGTVLILAATSCVLAADTAKSERLAPKEIADGWILLFDGETPFGWNIKGDSQIANGALLLGGKQAAEAVTTTQFGDFELRLEYRSEGQEAPSLSLRDGLKRNGYGLMAAAGNQAAWNEAVFRVESRKLRGELRTGADTKTVYEGAVSDRTPIGFQVAPGCKLTLRHVKLKPLGLKPIFNGNNLAGWKEFPGRKSQFSVTPEGWLHIKNGPGDLQTEGQWDDFVLQIECLSNGDRLNSGVFFRCRPNEYQNGYEAQIHNGFTAEPAKEYTIEAYDPNTHQLIGKKKAQYTAIDYGTGAIYRRIPARFQTAKDHEWFTMTVLARGNHLATWVNGIQMVDWMDNRPPNDNARNGCKLGKGPISLQGHDPTTDLSFRKIRIAAFPK